MPCIIKTSYLLHDNSFSCVLDLCLTAFYAVLAVDDRHVAFCEYNGSVAKIICVAVATLANEKLLERSSDYADRIKRNLGNQSVGN
jgi:hypothetical protein